ncbi:MAG: hemerythrin domain-containing protein, partial [Phaeodactylibacter sp.]|nr:hemerythrin domain-containing protein [Phaeodactylibacter sp.]
EIRELSNGFTPPEGACNTYRVLYALLEEFEEDLHRHVHLENNILFPQAVELEGSF